ncbi:hypothetical protein Ahy_A05g023225 [Arachis hypogaea]|uniref:SWIM-type domain-containing protein n=1 Tax=Arachis hypogaea TaxID=3818 RepID=A0A445D2N3_ARAHY|nr:hypothetical protein Ahy_A05g023225 [Arachis hypogaea]
MGSYDHDSSGVHQFSFEGACNLSLTAFVKAIFYRFNELFTKKRAKTEACINDGHIFSGLVTSMQINMHRKHSVCEMPSGVEYAFDLRRQHCDCSEFQVDRILCRLVYACCENQRIDWQVVYKARFRLLNNLTTWSVYYGSPFVPNSFLRRVTKSRPRMTCFLNEIVTRMLRGPRHCRQCGGEGHSCNR